MEQNENELIDISKLFGENLRKLRKEANLTQEQLSEKLEISQKHLSKIETGNQFASAQLISKIANILELNPSQLFEILDEATPTKELVNKIVSRVTANMMIEIKRQNDILYNKLHQEIEEIKNSNTPKKDIFGFPL